MPNMPLRKETCQTCHSEKHTAKLCHDASSDDNCVGRPNWALRSNARCDVHCLLLVLLLDNRALQMESNSASLFTSALLWSSPSRCRRNSDHAICALVVSSPLVRKTQNTSKASTPLHDALVLTSLICLATTSATTTPFPSAWPSLMARAAKEMACVFAA